MFHSKRKPQMTKLWSRIDSVRCLWYLCRNKRVVVQVNFNWGSLNWTVHQSYWDYFILEKILYNLDSTTLFYWFDASGMAAHLLTIDQNSPHKFNVNNKGLKEKAHCAHFSHPPVCFCNQILTFLNVSHYCDKSS